MSSVQLNKYSRLYFLAVPILALFLLPPTCMAQSSQADTYDAVRDFSTSSNPNGAWSYGWEQTVGGTFTLNTLEERGTNGGGIDLWEGPDSCGVPDLRPFVGFNNTGATLNYAGGVSQPAYALVLHPSCTGKLSVVRWTAPTSGWFNVVGLFLGIDTRNPTTDVHILHNSSTALLDTNINAFGGQVPVGFVRYFAASDTLDFVVGVGSNGTFNDDSTGLGVTITPSFPLAGTITGITAGSGLAGGGTSGNVTLNNTGVLSISTGSGLNTTGGQTPTLSLNTGVTDTRYLKLIGGALTGGLSAPSFVGNGAGLTGLSPANLSAGTAGINISGNAATATDASALGGVSAGNYARRDVANTLIGDQSITGNISTTGSLAVGGGTRITQHLSAAYSITVPSLKPNTCNTVSVSLNGAASGANDTIALGVPNSLMSAGGFLIFQGWESATNTISIRICNVNPNGPATSAAAGTIRVDLWKH